MIYSSARCSSAISAILGETINLTASDRLVFEQCGAIITGDLFGWFEVSDDLIALFGSPQILWF